VPWALLLLFYFLRRLRKNLEIVGQLAGVLASAIAVLRYEEINDWSVRLFGAGADNATVSIMLGVAVLAFIQLWLPLRTPFLSKGEPKAPGLQATSAAAATAARATVPLSGLSQPRQVRPAGPIKTG
jgi:hypothetical protein